jgi:peptidyl-tRNA hydrolase, PTH1 family
MDMTKYLIVGLGNPGREYRENRHNVGFMVLDRLQKQFGWRLARLQSNALVTTVNWEDHRLVLAKPQTYMNLSGQSVSALKRFYQLELDQMIVIHDDLDLPYGTLRIRPGGGSGGQKGLASIITHLGTQDFPRLRVGIGRPPGRMDAADYVLQAFSADEQKELLVILDTAVQALQVFIRSGLDTAMNEFNSALLGE